MLHQRYVLLAFVAAAILVGATTQSAAVSLIEAMHIPNMQIGFVTMSSAFSVGAAGATFVGLLRSRKAVSYADEVVDELTKVTWPSKDETLHASTTVLFTTLFTAAVLAGYDVLWKLLALYLYASPTPPTP